MLGWFGWIFHGQENIYGNKNHATALNILLKLPRTQKLQRQRDLQGTKKSKQNIKYAQDSTLTKGNEKFLLLFILLLRCISKKLPYAHLPMNTFENIFRL
jgi:hypothetical protein